MSRSTTLSRATGEVNVEMELNLDGTGKTDVATGLGFLDHLLDSFARHSGIDLAMKAVGDVDVDDHHTVEDCAIVLARGMDQILGDRSGIVRFGAAYAPLDEALVRAVVDQSGRGWPEIHLPFGSDMVGDVATENVVHFFRSMAIEGRMAIHIDLIRGDNSHHVAEAAMKAFAMATRQAVSEATGELRSTKGVLG